MDNSANDCLVIFLAQLVHTDALLADIASMPQNSIVRRYQVRHISMRTRFGQ